jgi:hypothetical protein
MFRDEIPYGLIDITNPVLIYEHARLRWLRTFDAVQRYNRRVLVGLPAVAGAWWLVERLNFGLGMLPVNAGNRLLLVLVVSSIGIMLLSSFYTVIATIGAVNLELTSGEWDLLRLTTQREYEILKAKDTVAQIRAWRITALEVGLRFASIVVLIMSAVYDLYSRTRGDPSFFTALFVTPFCYPFYLILPIMGMIYGLEPIWRTRALIAVCMAIALRVNGITTALLAGFGALLCVHLVQVALIGTTYTVLQAQFRSSDLGFGVICIFLPLCLVSGVGLYIAYAQIRTWGISAAFAAVFGSSGSEL